ncbi:MAG TPA: helix-turn-helix transcriptional regulator [Candidatus Paceibacterota bacterium]|nr:helix-turn-helix transcriptional regulator [Candidatus Paceibacterota bacterium]
MEYYPNDLRRLRERAGLKQTEVAAALGLASHDRISHWERGQAIPSLENLFKLAAAYGVFPHDLYPEAWGKVSGGRARAED